MLQFVVPRVSHVVHVGLSQKEVLFFTDIAQIRKQCRNTYQPILGRT